MQHPNILPRHDVNQLARLNVPNLDERWLERKDVWIVECECLWRSLPLDLPILSCSPAIPIDEEAEVRVVEKELAVQAFNMYRSDVLFPRHEV